MFKIVKTKFGYLIFTIVMAIALNACGEKTMIPNSLVHRFEHKTPESFLEKPGLSYDEFKPFMDGGVFFWGGATGDPDANTFDIGVQFHSETKGRRIYVEKLLLDTPNLKTQRVINEFLDIDRFSKSAKVYYKRLTPFEKINGDTIPVTAEFFTLKIDYKLEDSPTKQMSIRFDNASFLAPNF